MRILHFATDDITGGAARAGFRLHAALREAGHESRMIVRHKKSDDPDVHQVSTRPLLSQLRRLKRRVDLMRGRLPRYKFNQDLEPEIETEEFFSEASGSIDIICLHWITELLTTRLIKKIYEHYRCPLIWIMVDQEPVTGGCHYSLGCDRYIKNCGSCPQLNSKREHDRSRIVWRRKHLRLEDLPIVFNAPSSWVASRIQESSLFREHRIERIPLAIDTTVFRPFDKNTARDLLHLPANKKILFFGATYLEEERKGMAYLVEALSHFAVKLEGQDNKLRKEDIFLTVAGAHDETLLKSLPFPGRALGSLQDDVTLALAYQAADVFVCPSIEDAGPMMIPEAMLCGTPVVAFNTGGAPDLIEPLKTGYLVALGDATDFARGLKAMLSINDPSTMRAACRETAYNSHNSELVAASHIRLYKSLINS